MKILLTGGTGFVGENLLRYFSKNVSIMFVNIGRSPVKGVANCSNYIVSDLLEVKCWDSLMDGVDIVIHLAARVHVMSDDDPFAKDKYHQMNVRVTREMVKAAKKADVPKFIFLSTVKVMGEESSVPFQNNSKTNPEGEYAISKLLAEEVVESSLASHQNYFILRPPLMYGPGVKGNFMKLVMLAQLGLPLPFGSFNQKRSFLFVDNLISLIDEIMKKDLPSGKYFVSDDSDLSLVGLLSLVGEVIGKKVSLLRAPVRLMEIGFSVIGKKSVYKKLNSSLQVNITQTKSELKWTPPFTPKQGLRITLLGTK